jgi:acetyl esterase/lipase
VVLVHGGGWTSGDKSAWLTVAFAQAGSWPSIAYDLDEVSKWPTVDDTLTRSAGSGPRPRGADPSRLGLVGSSAGGNLVMLAATRGLGEGRAPIRAVVSWSGPSDLTDLAPTGESDAVLTHPSVLPIPGETTPPGCVGDVACIGLIGPEYIQAYMGCSLTECPDRYRAASPVFQVTASTPPMYLAAATEDLIPEEQTYEMVDALTAAGVTSRLQVIPGEGHAESYRPVALPPTIDFLTTFVANGADAAVPTDATPTTIAGSAALPPLLDGNRLPTPAALATGSATSAPASTSPGPGEGQLQHLDLIAIVVVLAVIGLFLLVRSRRTPLDDDYDDHAHDPTRDTGPDGADPGADPGDPSAG